GDVVGDDLGLAPRHAVVLGLQDGGVDDVAVIGIGTGAGAPEALVEGLDEEEEDVAGLVVVDVRRVGVAPVVGAHLVARSDLDGVGPRLATVGGDRLQDGIRVGGVATAGT